MAKTRINLSLDQDLADFARIYAAENRTTVADVMTQYLLSLKRAQEGDITNVILSDPKWRKALEESRKRLQSGKEKWYTHQEVFGKPSRRSPATGSKKPRK